MPKRKYHTDPTALLAEGREIVQTTHDATYRHRVEVVNLVVSGQIPSQLSQYVKESKNTITRWVKIADEQGLEALRPKKRAGRLPRLNAAQLSAIKSIVEQGDPKAQGYEVWDGLSLSSYIEKRYSIHLGVRQCQRLFHKLGFSLVRPQTYPNKGENNEEVRETFKKRSKNWKKMTTLL